MRRLLLPAACAAAVLCALGAQAKSAPVRAPAAAIPVAQAKGPYRLVAADATLQAIDILEPSGRRVGRIPNVAAQALAVGRDATVFAATASQALAFAKPYTAPPVVLQSGGYPAGVAVSPSGVVAVLSIVGQGGSNGFVAFFAPGAVKPCAVVSDPSIAKVYFGAFDAAGTFFLDGLDSTAAFAAADIVGGCGAKHMRRLQMNATIQFPGQVAVDALGHIAFGDQIADAVDAFDHPRGASLGSPVTKTALSGGSAASFAFTPDGRAIWADEPNGGLGAFAYPEGGGPMRSIAGTYGAVAVLPPLER